MTGARLIIFLNATLDSSLKMEMRTRATLCTGVRNVGALRLSLNQKTQISQPIIQSFPYRLVISWPGKHDEPKPILLLLKLISTLMNYANALICFCRVSVTINIIRNGMSIILGSCAKNIASKSECEES